MEAPISASTPAQVRETSARAARALPAGPDVYHVVDGEIAIPEGAVRFRRYVPQRSPLGTIVYFHGGGWVTGSIEAVDALCGTLALASDCEVVSITYRLAPEARFPSAVDDAYAAVCHVAAARDDRKPLVVAGDSSGGNLAAVCARRARDRSGPRLDLQLLVHPVTDHVFTTASYQQHGDCGLISRADMEWFWNQYVPVVSERNDPDAAPLRSDDLAGLPPAYIVVCGHDPLRDEGERYASRLRTAGVDVVVARYDDMVHGFAVLLPLIAEGRRAVHEMARHVQGVVGGAWRSPSYFER